MKSKKFPVSGFAFLVIIVTIFRSSIIADAVKNSLELCFSVIIPSLFPFMVISSQLVGNMKCNLPKPVNKLCNFLFGFSGYGIGAFSCGILCGYPIGAKCSAQLYKEGMISKSEAETLVACANNSGPLFIIGAVGGLLKSPRWGVILYGVHIICALVSAIILKSRTYIKPHFLSSGKKEKPLTESISESVVNILNICGFIVFFSVVNVLAEPVAKLFPETMQNIIYCILELTNGIEKLGNTNGLFGGKLYLTAFALGWSGISVHMQVKSIVKELGLSMKKYYFSKSLSAILSPLILFMALDLKDMLFSLVSVTTLKVIIVSFAALGLCTVMIVARKRKKVM